MPERPVKDIVLFELEKSYAGARRRAKSAAKDAYDLLQQPDLSGMDIGDLRDAAEELVQRVHELNAYGNAVSAYLKNKGKP